MPKYLSLRPKIIKVPPFILLAVITKAEGVCPALWRGLAPQWPLPLGFRADRSPSVELDLLGKSRQSLGLMDGQGGQFVRHAGGHTNTCNSEVNNRLNMCVCVCV